jgi:hypothetical protein
MGLKYQLNPKNETDLKQLKALGWDSMTDQDIEEDAISDEDILSQAKEAYELCSSAETENRTSALNDMKFAKLGEQWPSDVKTKRESESRPCLTINKMPTFIRQVVNDARQNKPQIKVKAADSRADPKTAEVLNGLIRNIEHISNADVSYDTAIDNAASGGVGYIRVNADYAYDDVFDMDLLIERVINPFSVYGDPNSTAADGSDWNVAFVTDRITKKEFKKRYKGKANTDFSGVEWQDAEAWLNDDGVMIAEYWVREVVDKKIVQLSNGHVFTEEDLMSEPDLLTAIQVGQLQVTNERTTKGHKVTQYLVSGVDVLEKNDWPGKYIPIIPVYGDEFAIEGKRYFRSLIHSAKDAQRMLNYWRSTSTELVALAPRVPFIGPKGSFAYDEERWETANTESHAYLEYDPAKGPPPQRQPLDMGVAAGALQEALNANDDIKSVIGMYDASIGARSNETSGKAIMARQREGDTSTFHFIDNLSRSIRQVGRVLIDLIPSVYSGERVIRVLGEDGKEQNVPLGTPTPKLDKKGQPETDEQGQIIMAMHDLTVGKYDLAVDAGPSFTSRREEAAMQMTEMIRAFPQAAPVLGGPLARNMDWPGAQEIADKLDKLDPTNKQELPPQIQQAMEQGKQKIAELEQENAQLKMQMQNKQGELKVDEFEAQTDRIKVEAEIGEKVANLVGPYI